MHRALALNPAVAELGSQSRLAVECDPLGVRRPGNSAILVFSLFFEGVAWSKLAKPELIFELASQLWPFSFGKPLMIFGEVGQVCRSELGEVWHLVHETHWA